MERQGQGAEELQQLTKELEALELQLQAKVEKRLINDEINEHRVAVYANLCTYSADSSRGQPA